MGLLDILTANAAATRLPDANYDSMTLKTRDDSSVLMDRKDFCFMSKLYSVSTVYHWDVIWRVNNGSNLDLRCLMKQTLASYDGIDQWLAAGVNIPEFQVDPVNPWALIPRTKVRYIDFVLPDVTWISPTALPDTEPTTGPGTTPSASCNVIDVRFLNGAHPGGIIALQDVPQAINMHAPFWFKIWIDKSTSVEYRIEEYLEDNTLVRVITADQSDWHLVSGTTDKYWVEERNFYDIPSGWTTQLTVSAPDTSSLSTSIFQSGFLNSDELCPDEE
jgi:hypothetical protein